MSDEKKQLLDDMAAFLQRVKNDRFLWEGRWGLGPSHREDVNEMLARFRELEASC